MCSLITSRLGQKDSAESIFAQTSLLQIAQAAVGGLSKSESSDDLRALTLPLTQSLIATYVSKQSGEWVKSQVLSKAIFAALFDAIRADKAVVSWL